MIKEIDPTRSHLTWYTDNGVKNKRIKDKAVTVERQAGMWVVEWWDCGAGADYKWVKFNIYRTREEAETAAEMVFLIQPWR